MKYCDHCGKEFDIPEALRPLCGRAPRETDDADETAAIMLLPGLL